MLNYIWLGLILAGIIAALSTDITELISDKYRNNQSIDVLLSFDEEDTPAAGKDFTGTLTVNLRSLYEFYGIAKDNGMVASFDIHLTFSSPREAVIRIPSHPEFPTIWHEMVERQGNGDVLAGTIQLVSRKDTTRYEAKFKPDPIRFASLQRVTNDGIVAYASTAVTIALGLIGIMTLWLGIMKVAEEAGLVQTIASGLKPIMTRLFPDVPANHPAMGAMILNISANMLGLANAATPLGLKAMEELNKLNKKIGTATDAMCTFLVINTSSVQLIPATVIAVRAAAGSASPTEIIVPMIIATSAATVAGVIAVKLLQRLPVYRKQLD